jgi:signal transduction histidine kinase
MEHVERIRRLEDSLAQNEGLALTGTLLAAGNHEVKNLAMIIQGAVMRASQVFQNSGISGGEQALQSLQRSSELLVDIVRQMQFLQNENPSAVETVNLVTVLNDIVLLMRERVAPYFLKVDLDAAVDGCALVQGRVTAIKQILINLMLNAQEAIREKDPADGGMMLLSLRRSNGHWQVVLKDNGVGLPSPATLREFKAFSTTRKLRGGQGLGLWLCQKLARTMGGDLCLRSEGVGKGAEAQLTLGGGQKEPDLNLADYFVN